MAFTPARECLTVWRAESGIEEAPVTNSGGGEAARRRAPGPMGVRSGVLLGLEEEEEEDGVRGVTTWLPGEEFELAL